MARSKIAIIGAGNVGATTAHWAVAHDLGDIALVDVVDGVPQGKGLDLAEAAPVEGYDSRIEGSSTYEVIEGADIVVITAGFPRLPGMSRDDLLGKNAAIMRDVIGNVKRYAPDSILIPVANPLDAMAYIALKDSGFPRERVVGMAGVLDTARFRTFLAMELDCSVEDVQAFVLGGHGDTMVPLLNYTTMAGIPVKSLIEAGRLEEIVTRTRKGGGEIVALLKKGSAFYAPAAAVVQMCESILKDKKRILPCAAYLDGEYGTSGHFLGVPVKLGENGIEQILELELSPDENDQLQTSIMHVKELTEAVKKFL
jgi:malate dehydrogenase